MIGQPVQGPRNGRPDAIFDLEDDLWRAAALNDLAHWIARAQQLAASLRLALAHDEPTKNLLKARGVEVYGPEWHAHHAQGLEVLHMTIDDHLREVRIAAGIEKAASAETTGGRHEH